MKYIVMAAVAASTISMTATAHAGSLSSPWDEPEVTPILCPMYGILWGLVQWRYCPKVGSPSPDSPNGPSVTPSGPPTGDPEDPTDGKPKPDRLKGNNGLGNGDQRAPGNSGPNNRAENQKGNPGHASGKDQNAN